MKQLLYYLRILALLLVVHKVSICQDVAFTQFYSNPLYLNPAFTGTLEIPRLNLQYRQQWHSFSNAYTTQSLSFDTRIKKIKGGIGFNLMNDSQADNIFKSLQFNAIYATYIRIGKEMNLSGALQAGYVQNSLDWSRLIFADNLDPYFGNHGITSETVITDTKFGYFDFSSGAILYNDMVFTGIAVHHLAEPYTSWYGSNSGYNRLKRKYTLHFGSRIPVRIHGEWRKKFDAMPQVVCINQGKFWQFNYGMLANWKGLTSGAWFRQDKTFDYDSVILLIGYMKRRWHFTYSYDFTVSGMAGHSGGTSEFSLGFLIKDFTRNLPFPFYAPYEDYLGR